MAIEQSTTALSIHSSLQLLGRKIRFSHAIPGNHMLSGVGFVVSVSVAAFGTGERDGVLLRLDPNDPDQQDYFDLSEIDVFWIEPPSLDGVHQVQK